MTAAVTQTTKPPSIRDGRVSHDTLSENAEKRTGRVLETHAASVALAAALAERPPNMWSSSMMRLYGIMAVGYLVSTINGFGKP